MEQAVRFEEIMRRLAIIDEDFVERQAGFLLAPAGTAALDAKTAALLRLAAAVAIGSPPVFLEWSTSRALAAGASNDEITGTLLAVAPVAGLSRVVSAGPNVAAALGYDVEAALLDESDDPPTVSLPGLEGQRLVSRDGSGSMVSPALGEEAGLTTRENAVHGHAEGN